MTEVLLYHHVQGLTEGVRSFADELRQTGHTVHTPDLFERRTFGTIEEGMAFAREAGVEEDRRAGTSRVLEETANAIGGVRRVRH